MNIVVGGGWAGIAAAVELARAGAPVTLIEAAGELGGRGRRVHHRDLTVDSGQHLMIGAYHGVLHLLRVMDIPEARAFERRPLELLMRSTRAPELRLRLPGLPAPLHLVAGLLAARGVGWTDRARALRLCAALAWSSRRSAGRADCSVMTLLRRHRQSRDLVERLWTPLCLATLNTPPEEASAALFTRVMHDAFARRRHDSDLLLPRTDLGDLIPRPAHRFIEHHGGTVLLGQRVRALRTGDDRITGVTLAGGQALDARNVVVAVPPEAARRLLEPVPALGDIAARLGHMRSAPICTVYLRYPPHISLPVPMLGLHGTATAQWVFDHTLTGHPGLVAAVISGSGQHMALEKTALQDKVAGELAAFFPHWPPPLQGLVLKEKRATFLSSVGVDALRPAASTPVAGCWLAGDAVDTGYPATLEGAVRSGLDAARRAAAAKEG